MTSLQCTLALVAIALAPPSTMAATLPITTGVFADPIPAACVCSGIGTNTFYNGGGTPTEFSFEGLSFSPIIDVGIDGARFQIGSVYIRNGDTYPGTEASRISLLLAAVTAKGLYAYTPSQYDVLFTFTANNTGNAYLDRDFYFIPTVGLLSVDEGATTTIPLFAKVYPLIGPFLTSGEESERALYGITLDGFGEPTGGGHIESMPEPGTATLVVTGAIAACYYGRRRAGAV